MSINFTNIDKTIDKWETKLTEFAAIPVAGTLAGGVKILMGAAQAITALVVGILLLIHTACTGNGSLVEHSWIHITHGLGNMVAGTLEAIPLLGTGLYYLRDAKALAAPYAPLVLKIAPSQESKFMPYPSLVELDWKFTGMDHMAVFKANEYYAKKVEQNGGEENISLSRKLELAKETLSEFNLY